MSKGIRRTRSTSARNAERNLQINKIWRDISRESIMEEIHPSSQGKLSHAIVAKHSTTKPSTTGIRWLIVRLRPLPVPSAPINSRVFYICDHICWFTATKNHFSVASVRWLSRRNPFSGNMLLLTQDQHQTVPIAESLWGVLAELKSILRFSIEVFLRTSLTTSQQIILYPALFAVKSARISKPSRNT